MEKKELYDYVVLGWTYYVLAQGYPWGTNEGVLSSIDFFRRFLRQHELEVTREVVDSSLKEIRDDLIIAKMDAVISKDLSMKLRTTVKQAEATLDAELKLHEAYLLTEKRFELDKLVSHIEDLFGERTFAALPQVVQYDFTEAGKCIAFERPTAAAFHILRGTEGTLRMYYLSLVKRKRIPDLLWGPIITELTKKNHTPKPLLDSLDHIRVNFRNPVSHPEAIFNLDEAQDLLSVCIDATNRLVNDMYRQKLLPET